MRIQVNGEPCELPEAASVEDLLQHMQLLGRRVAVELNLELVPRSRYPVTCLSNGDHVEVVHAIGGG